MKILIDRVKLASLLQIAPKDDQRAQLNSVLIEWFPSCDAMQLRIVATDGRIMGIWRDDTINTYWDGPRVSGAITIPRAVVAEAVKTKHATVTLEIHYHLVDGKFSLNDLPFEDIGQFVTWRKVVPEKVTGVYEPLDARLVAKFQRVYGVANPKIKVDRYKLIVAHNHSPDSSALRASLVTFKDCQPFVGLVMPIQMPIPEGDGLLAPGWVFESGDANVGGTPAHDSGCVGRQCDAKEMAP